MVTLYDTSGAVLDTTTTDANGHYEYDGDFNHGQPLIITFGDGQLDNNILTLNDESYTQTVSNTGEGVLSDYNDSDADSFFNGLPAIYLTAPIGGANGSYDIGWIVEEIDPVFDLALTNTVDPSSIPADGTFDNGDTIIFSVNVINQGNVDGTDIVIADIVPCGMQVFDETIPTNDSTGWSALDADTTRITIDSLSAGMSMQIPIAMIVEVPAVGCPVETLDPYMNFTYVESANDDMGMPAGDIDSELGPLTAEELAVKPNMAGDNDIESSGNTDIGSQDDSDPANIDIFCLLYTSPSPRDLSTSRMPSSA